MIKEFYDKTGSDFADTMQRIGNEAFIEKLVSKFFDDKNIVMLREALSAGDVKAAFMAAHSLKGVALNLGFTKLAKSSSDLTELLRPNPNASPVQESAALPNDAKLLFDAVESDYAALRDAYQVIMQRM